MLLSSITRLRADLGFDSMTNFNNAATEALNQAELQLMSALGVEFQQQTVTDTFYIPEPSFCRNFFDFRTEFRLSQGFVNPTPAVSAIAVAKAGMFWFGRDHIVNNPDTLDVSANMVINYDKGVCTDTTYAYRHRWVTFTYTAGFPADGTDATSYDLTVVPTWLQTASHMAARIIMQSNPALEDPAIKLDTTMMQKNLNVMLSSKLRYTPAAYLSSSHSP